MAKLGLWILKHVTKKIMGEGILLIHDAIPGQLCHSAGHLSKWSKGNEGSTPEMTFPLCTVACYKSCDAMLSAMEACKLADSCTVTGRYLCTAKIEH